MSKTSYLKSQNCLKS